jgi:hypothetical protein
LKQAAPAVSPRDHRSRGGVHLDLLLDDRAPSEDAEDAENFDYLTDHLTSEGVGWAAWRRLSRGRLRYTIRSLAAFSASLKTLATADLKHVNAILSICDNRNYSANSDN